jgi:choline dehydrogenase
LDAFLQAGNFFGFSLLDPNGPDGQTGFSPYLFTIKDGQRWSTADAYLRPAVQTRKNLHVSLSSHVRKIIVDDNKKVATGVVLSRNGGYSTIEVIFFINKIKGFLNVAEDEIAKQFPTE